MTYTQSKKKKNQLISMPHTNIRNEMNTQHKSIDLIHVSFQCRILCIYVNILHEHAYCLACYRCFASICIYLMSLRECRYCASMLWASNEPLSIYRKLYTVHIHIWRDYLYILFIQKAIGYMHVDFTTAWAVEVAFCITLTRI